jgi:rhamnogalacturonyl hydrolase YesR
MAWLHLARATGDSSHLARARALGDEVLGAGPGPFTNLLSGAAGEGLFALRLWEATGDARYLDGARGCAEWLAGRALHGAGAGLWPARDPAAAPPGSGPPGGGAPQSPALGFTVGAAGVAYVLALVHQATGEARWRDLVAQTATAYTGLAAPAPGGVNWPRRLGEADLTRFQGCYGAPAVGLFLVKAHEVTGERRFLRLAEAAGAATFAAGDVRRNPSQCHGLAGNAELFLELHRATGDDTWREGAHDFARRALAYRTSTPEGDVWQADEPGVHSPDYMCGAAGVGHFFLQLLSPAQVRLPVL